MTEKKKNTIKEKMQKLRADAKKRVEQRFNATEENRQKRLEEAAKIPERFSATLSWSGIANVGLGIDKNNNAVIRVSVFDEKAKAQLPAEFEGLEVFVENVPGPDQW